MATHICGDSIALGLSHVMTGVAALAVQGATPAEIVDYVRAANFLIVSAGTNGPAALVRAGLDAIRARADALSCRFVIWILPIESFRRQRVQQVGATHGDDTVAFVPGPDDTHPADYAALANAVRAKMLAHTA